MIYGVGTDIIEIDRIRKAMERFPKFVERLFSAEELAYLESKALKPQHVAGGFSAKEAVLKSMGTGLRNFKWKEIEIVRDMKGRPFVRLNGKAKDYADTNYIGDIHISISHSREFATATAVAEVSIEKRWMDLESMLVGANAEIRRSIN
ncbi:holo-ACP synthase [Lutispora thermophila]|uniref:holo-ACP synthase n=1 Tax=Lutispora thermophila TaxID=288966 RepID=UPI0009FD99BD|nr:holo-ACP synthase [Lutispora thermophila]